VAKELLGDVFYDLVAEVTKQREKLCEAKHDDIVEAAYTAARVLERGLKTQQIPAAPETLRKVRSAKRKLKAELEHWQGEYEDDELEVDMAPQGAAKKKGERTQ
jgi:hypothetical protein